MLANRQGQPDHALLATADLAAFTKAQQARSSPSYPAICWLMDSKKHMEEAFGMKPT